MFGSLIGLGAVQFVAIVFAFCICKVKLIVNLQKKLIYHFRALVYKNVKLSITTINNYPFL